MKVGSSHFSRIEGLAITTAPPAAKSASSGPAQPRSLRLCLCAMGISAPPASPQTLLEDAA